MSPHGLRTAAILVAAHLCCCVRPAVGQPPASSGPAGDASVDSPALAMREREVLVVRHIREHLAMPEDGVALSADRTDLRTLALAAARTQQAGSTDPLEALSVVVETWYRRVNERTNFALMGPAQAQRVDDARRALAQSLGGLSAASRQRLAPAFDEELRLLAEQFTGRGDLPDSFIDRALAVADAGGVGRPAPYAGNAPGPGPYPYAPPRAPIPYPGPPGPRPEPSNPYGQYAEPALDNPANPAGSAGGAYATSSAGGGCQASRVVAGDAFTSEAFLRNAECWSRQKVWPGWASQVVEALTWAVDAAVYNRDCPGLDAVARQMGSLSAGPTPFPDDRVRMAELRHRLDAERAWLHGTACR